MGVALSAVKKQRWFMVFKGWETILKNNLKIILTLSKRFQILSRLLEM